MIIKHEQPRDRVSGQGVIVPPAPQPGVGQIKDHEGASHQRNGGASPRPGWVAALTPLSVDGMNVAASTRLLADSRSGRKGGALPWALLVAGSVASLAVNVAVAEPTLIGQVIAAWPSLV